MNSPQKLKPAETSTKAKVKQSFSWERLTALLYPLAFGALVLILWETGVLNGILGVENIILPFPSDILANFYENFGSVMENSFWTIVVAVSGLLVGSLIGYALAAFADAFPKWGIGSLSLVAAFNAIPIIAIAPITRNLTSDFSRDPFLRSLIAKALVVVVITMVVMSINAYRGFRELKPHSLELMKSIAAKKSSIFWQLKVPNSLPYVFTALRVSVPGSIITAMISEYFAEYIIGVGRQIRDSILQSQYKVAWTYIVAAFFIGIGMYAVLLLVERLLLKGRPRQ
jgi:NitT/TauT family transport system permease protein